MGFQAVKLHDVLHEELPEPELGILVDRLWPRGVRKDNPLVQQWRWYKDVTPSTELRKWFGHDPQRYDAFAQRYRAELDARRGEPEVETLLYLGHKEEVALLYAAKDRHYNHARILAQWAKEHCSDYQANAVLDRAESE